ncbi:MAG: hypothetical protein ABIA93_04300 [Candidatus Woesearchaeota archaeon]
MDFLSEAKQQALIEIEKYGSPPLILFELANKKAEELGKKLGADMEVLMAGMYLMDLKLGEALKAGKLKEHTAWSAKAAETILDQHGIKGEKRDKIMNCILAHHKAIPFSCKEAELCVNADCYKFLHPRGFFAFLVELGERSTPFDKALEYAEQKLDEKIEHVSMKECKEELEPYYKELKKMISDSRIA